jgi:hypothetical protein
MEKSDFVIAELEHFEEMWDVCSIDYKQRFYAGWVSGILDLGVECMDEIFDAGYINGYAFIKASKEMLKNGDE